MTNREVIVAFVDAINARATDALAELMSADHTFIDAHGNEVIGREQMLAGAATSNGCSSAHLMMLGARVTVDGLT